MKFGEFIRRGLAAQKAVDHVMARQLKDRIRRETAAQEAAEEADETKRKLQADYRKDR